MRIRTDNRPERRDVIEDAARVWDCNKTDAVIASCELAVFILDDFEDALADPRIPAEVIRDIVDDLEGLHLEVDTTDPDVEIRTK